MVIFDWKNDIINDYKRIPDFISVRQSVLVKLIKEIRNVFKYARCKCFLLNLISDCVNRN